jgi:hypothetical protein
MPPRRRRPAGREPLEAKSSCELVAYFRETAAYRGWAMEEGDPKDGNRACDILDKIWAELSRRNAANEVGILLSDGDPGVRLAAAGKLFRPLPEEAVNVLRELSTLKTVVGLSAAATLEAIRRYGPEVMG